MSNAGPSLPWDIDGRCRVCDAPNEAFHDENCWLSLSLLWMRQRCAEQQVSEPASPIERPYRPSPQEAASQVLDFVTGLTEFGYATSITIEMPGGNSLTMRGTPDARGSSVLGTTVALNDDSATVVPETPRGSSSPGGTS